MSELAFSSYFLPEGCSTQAHSHRARTQETLLAFFFFQEEEKQLRSRGLFLKSHKGTVFFFTFSIQNTFLNKKRTTLSNAIRVRSPGRS